MPGSARERSRVRRAPGTGDDSPMARGGLLALAAEDFALLMTHHPPTWLTTKAREELYGEIAPPGRFVAHLYGHMHEHHG